MLLLQPVEEARSLLRLCIDSDFLSLLDGVGGQACPLVENDSTPRLCLTILKIPVDEFIDCYE